MKNPVSVNPQPVYQALATALDALRRCEKTPNHEWTPKWEERIEQLVKDCMPSGSGIDCGTKLDLNASDSDTLVFDVDYHHMNDGGYYDGWTHHRVIVTPSLMFGFELRITGKDRRNIKEYLHEVYECALSQILEANRPTPQCYVDADGNVHGEEPTIPAVNS